MLLPSQLHAPLIIVTHSPWCERSVADTQRPPQVFVQPHGKNLLYLFSSMPPTGAPCALATTSHPPLTIEAMLSGELPSLGPFVLDERIARGGMGEVWRGHHHILNEIVAIKVLDPQRPPTARTIEALHKEVRAIAQLNHEAIVRIHDYGELTSEWPTAASHWHHGAPYFVMEYAAGGALHQVAHGLSWPQIRHLLLTILSALAHAHSRGVIHRDLKPGNILLRQGVGALDDILISDFGLAYALHEELDEQRARRAAFLVGTPAYMAPEQIQHALRDLGPWTDLYALGCMTWQLLHGHPPFGSHEQGDVLRGHVHDALPPWQPNTPVPDGLHTWMRSLLAKNPYDRFAFASEAARALTLLDHVDEPVLGLSEHERSIPMPDRVHFRDAGLGLYELKPVPLIGRHGARNTMWRTFEAMIATQTPHLIVLRGEAGVGKSRLAQWLVERGHEAGAALALSAFHEPNPQAMQVLRHMLNKELRVMGLNSREARQRITHYIERWQLPDDTDETVAQDIRVLTLLTDAARIMGEGADSPLQLPSWQERQSTWMRLLRRLTQRKALIIWIDDAQWANDTLSLAEHTFAEGRALRLPVLIIATLRDDALQTRGIHAEQFSRLIRQAGEHITQIQLDALPPLDHEHLIRELLPLSSPLITQVAERTQGNPLFTIQLVGDWVQRGALHAGAHGMELDYDEVSRLPDDINQLWRRRVQQVVEASDAQQAHNVLVALQAAAVLGREVLPAEWASLCAVQDVHIPVELLDHMVAHRLAILTDNGWSFYHEMLRESLLLMAEQTHQRRALHHAAALMLRERYDTRLPRIAERLAYHEIGAGHHASALPLLLISLHHFRAVGELFRAHHVVRHWEHAVEQLRLPHGDLLLIKGLLAIVELLITQGDLDAAEERLDTTAQHAKMSGEICPRVEVELVRARLYRKRGDHTRALHTLEHAFVLLHEELNEHALRDEHDTLRTIEVLDGRATMALGEVLASLGRFEEARQKLLIAIKHFKRMDTPHEELGQGLLVMSEVLYNQQKYDLSNELLAEAIGQFTRQNNQIALASCANFQGDLARRSQRPDVARAHYLRARALLHALGSSEALVPSLNLILLAITRGEDMEALRYISGVREVLHQQGRDAHVGVVDLAEACGLIVSGEVERGEQLAMRGIDTLESSGLVGPEVAFLSERIQNLLGHADSSTPGVHARLTQLLHTQRARQNAHKEP